MFTGIVEATSEVLQYKEMGSVHRLTVQRPASFDDLRTGDSICVNGVCLTVVAFDRDAIQFDVALETKKVTGWNFAIGEILNLERSMKVTDRVHGHFVSGHVDEMGTIKSIEAGSEDAKGLRIQFSSQFAKLIWKKGSVTMNGVSLTVNDVSGSDFSVWLIPETLARTNLSRVKIGDRVTLEADMMARFWLRQKELNVEQNI
jgi:riboflavin synthase